jgi:membrane-bound lytic murein transglycosylase F
MPISKHPPRLLRKEGPKKRPSTKKTLKKPPHIYLTLGFFAVLLLFADNSQHSAYTGDLPEMKSRNLLRVIVRPEPVMFLPQSAYPVALDRTIAEELASELGMELSFVVAKNYFRMVDKLLNGEGDIIAANMAASESWKKRIAFSTPYLHADELLITSYGKDMPETVEELGGKEVCVRRSSSYFETLTELKKTIPDLVIREMPEFLDTEEIIYRVAKGECFSTIAYSTFWEAVSDRYETLGAPLKLAETSPIALAVRPDSKLLKRKLNEFLISRALTGHRQELYTEDFDGIKKRKVLRMITRNSSMTYYIYRGTQVGFEYELLKRYADENRLRLEIVIPPSSEDLITWLQEGRGDVIAAAMTITDVRADKVAFTIPYNLVEEVVVTAEDNDRINEVEDLKEKTVHVRKSSSYYETLKDLNDKVKGIKVARLPEEIETEEILRGVEEGEWEITVTDSNILEVVQTYGRRLRLAFALKNVEIAWAVRKENRVLKASLDGYIKKQTGGVFLNVLKKKYFKDKKTIVSAFNEDEFRSDLSGRISPYDELAKKYAEKHGFDWRLIAAQMYQESRFNPRSVSWAGARGLMQLMPQTARELGVADLRHPDASIRGGTKYMSQLINRFDPEIPLEDRIRFALASYNVGYGHVSDARRLAAQMDLNPDKWFDNVEKAMLLLQKPRYYTKARHGYCRGSEPVRYVREIQGYYDAYVELVPLEAQEESTVDRAVKGAD